MNKIARVVVFEGDSPSSRQMTLNTTVLVNVDEAFLGTENETAHIQTQAIKKLRTFNCNLTADHTLLYVNGFTCSRRQLGQRLYVVKKDDVLLPPVEEKA